MRLIIIGAVAGGTSAAAKARRNDEFAEIVIYTKGKYVSYSGCGMPYHISGEVPDGESLHPRDINYFLVAYNVVIKGEHEVTKINPKLQTVEVKDLATGKVFEDRYDKLVIATGARAVKPPLPGIDQKHVFSLRTISDMYAIKNYINESKPKNAVVIGAGFIGLEMVESLTKLGISVSLVEMQPQVATNIDLDLAMLVEKELIENGVKVYTNSAAKEISQSAVLINENTLIPADLVIVAVGIRPNTELANEAGIKLGKHRGILVNEKLETNLPNIYAAGDCTEQYHMILKDYVYVPLGSTANKQGRVAGDALTGGNLKFKGILGTSIYRVFSLTIATTGINAEQAEKAGLETVSIYNIKPDKVTYMGGEDMYIKALAHKTTGRILGAQIVGPKSVDRRIDVFSTAIHFGATAKDLMDLDLAYAPPYSTSRDPVNYTGMIINNILTKEGILIEPEEVIEAINEKKPLTIIDLRAPELFNNGHIEGALNIPLTELREQLDQIDNDQPIVFYCNRGLDGYLAQTIFNKSGFSNAYSINGGYKAYLLAKEKQI